MIYRMVDKNTKVELDEERVVAIKKNPLRLEFSHRNKNDGSRSFWQAPVAAVEKLVTETVDYATKASQSSTIGMGWSSPEITTATYDGLWKALAYKARNPDLFMDVTNVTLEEGPGYLKRSKTITATNQRVTEHIYAKEREGEMIYRMVDQNTKAELGEERVVAVKKDPLRLEFFHRHSVDGYRSFCQAPVTIVQKLVNDTIDFATKGSVSPTIGMGWTSPEITTATYDGLWRALIYKARNPQKFMEVTNVVVDDRPGFLVRFMTITASNQRVTEH